MGTGRINEPDLLKLMLEVAGVPGDFAEIGAWQGVTTRMMLPEAVRQDKLVHVFDSFHGLAPPGPHDNDYFTDFNVGGVRVFAELMSRHGADARGYRLWPGWIPACFDDAFEMDALSFVYLDVDHYQPTFDALVWLWPRLSPGALLLLDDVCFGNKGVSLALTTFLAEAQDILWTRQDIANDQTVLRIGGR